MILYLCFEVQSTDADDSDSGGVMTKLAKDSMPADTHSFLTDTPELAAGFSLCM